MTIEELANGKYELVANGKYMELKRSGVTVTCPHGDQSAWCGSWCALFGVKQVERKVYEITLSCAPKTIIVEG